MHAIVFKIPPFTRADALFPAPDSWFGLPACVGAYPPFGDPIANIWHGYASHGVVIEANFFSLSHENGSGVLLASADNVIISA